MPEKIELTKPTIFTVKMFHKDSDTFIYDSTP